MKEKDKTEIVNLREEIKGILSAKYPSNSQTKIKWSLVSKNYPTLVKETTLRRYLGFVTGSNQHKYEDIEKLEEIKKIINGMSGKLDKIPLSSTDTSNFSGYYLIISPSSMKGSINLFPLEILQNGDFSMRYIHKGDFIRGITSLVGNYISFYANRKYNDISNSHIPFSLHAIFNIKSSLSRNDLRPFNAGLATRRIRDTEGLKSVIEILIKVDKAFYDSFNLMALTLEKTRDKMFLLNGATEYLDDEIAKKLLQNEITVKTIAKEGKVIPSKKSLANVVNAFYPLLIGKENAIHLDKLLFSEVKHISDDLKAMSDDLKTMNIP